MSPIDTKLKLSALWYFAVDTGLYTVLIDMEDWWEEIPNEFEIMAEITDFEEQFIKFVFI